MTHCNLILNLLPIHLSEAEISQDTPQLFPINHPTAFSIVELKCILNLVFLGLY